MGKNKNKDVAEKKAPGFSSKMVCSRCEKTIGVRKEIYDKRVERFGGEDIMKRDYICLGCKRELSGDDRKDDIKPTASKADIEEYVANKKAAKKSKQQAKSKDKK